MPNAPIASFTVSQLRSNHALNEAIDLMRQGYTVFVDYDDITTERQRAYFARIGLKDKVQAEFEMTYKELRELALKDDISAGKMAAAITDQAGFMFGGTRL